MARMRQGRLIRLRIYEIWVDVYGAGLECSTPAAAFSSFRHWPGMTMRSVCEHRWDWRQAEIAVERGRAWKNGRQLSDLDRGVWPGDLVEICIPIPRPRYD